MKTIREALAADTSLTETLAAIGLQHRKNGVGYQHDVVDGNDPEVIIFSGTANDTWCWLRERAAAEERRAEKPMAQELAAAGWKPYGRHGWWRLGGGPSLTITEAYARLKRGAA